MKNLSYFGVNLEKIDSFKKKAPYHTVIIPAHDMILAMEK